MQCRKAARYTAVLRLPRYVARLRSGAMNTRTEPAEITDTGPLVVLAARGLESRELSQFEGQLRAAGP